MTQHTLPAEVEKRFDEYLPGELFLLPGGNYREVIGYTPEGPNGEDSFRYAGMWINIGELKQFLADELAQALQEAEKDNELILDTLYAAVSGTDQRFMEEQGIYLDNRYEHLGAMKILKHLQALSQPEGVAPHKEEV